ncbi:MAG: hypothetical protein JNL98_30070, partial [Bryobacterales bacterium]|nr:hypothetical protein [Bryobacterales bacterium]
EYDSLERNTAGDFGFGWRLSYNAGFEVDELHNVTMTMGGSRKTFQLTPVPNPIFQGLHAIVYTAPAGRAYTWYRTAGRVRTDHRRLGQVAEFPGTRRNCR